MEKAVFSNCYNPTFEFLPQYNTMFQTPQWISKASSRQRAGRAGRTRAGVCFHLFSRKRLAVLREFHDSELLRSPLDEICLQAKVCE